MAMRDNTGIGIGIVQNPEDKKYYIVMQVDQANISVALTIAGQDDYERHIDALVTGLNQVKEQMRSAASGLMLVKEIPDGYSPIPVQERRGQQQPRRSGKQGTRPPSR